MFFLICSLVVQRAHYYLLLSLESGAYTAVRITSQRGTIVTYESTSESSWEYDIKRWVYLVQSFLKSMHSKGSQRVHKKCGLWANYAWFSKLFCTNIYLLWIQFSTSFLKYSHIYQFILLCDVPMNINSRVFIKGVDTMKDMRWWWDKLCPKIWN